MLPKTRADQKTQGGFSVTVSSNKPAFNVMLDAGNLEGVFTDNNFFLNGRKTVVFETESDMTVSDFKKGLKVYDLYSSSQED